MIKFDNVSKRYGKKQILNKLSFEIPDGKFAVLIGPSGCGKTTTLKMINRLIEPDEGKIYIDGKDIESEDKVQLRRSIGYVIQQIGLFPNMTVAENICVVPKLLKYDKERCDQIVHDMLNMVGMPYDEYAGKYPNEMSGGQQQRIGVLRALAASPPIVLMDEPFGALDPLTREVLQDEMKKLQKKLNKTIVFVTHDMGEALKLADTIIFMEKGQIVQMAPPEEMLKNPSSSLVRSFLGKHSDGEMSSISVEDFMRTNIITVDQDRGILECTERMARSGVDTVVVVDEEDKYVGTVSIRDIKLRGMGENTIKPLISRNVQTVQRDGNAQECFDYLLNSGDNYVIVLNEDDTLAGIVTKNSMAKALSEALWG
ncbi:MAG: betaine/proline/choline family ABC transporter ATP-binding protein [Clostridiales bacterium]|jgi:osmoprotectant transport system ATP-binding protein|nr:betaine/proline/choline family ABC transporter ATP-binding protein [Clostridiales bacterium]